MSDACVMHVDSIELRFRNAMRQSAFIMCYLTVRNKAILLDGIDSFH